jgi:hypothetical protein
MAKEQISESFLTKRDAARCLKVSIQTLNRLMGEGLPYIKLRPSKAGGVRLRTQDIELFAASRRVG